MVENLITFEQVVFWAYYDDFFLQEYQGIWWFIPNKIMALTLKIIVKTFVQGIILEAITNDESWNFFRTLKMIMILSLEIFCLLIIELRNHNLTFIVSEK